MNKPEGWDDWTWWQVVEIYDPYSEGVQNMTHDEIVSSLLSDLLDLHFDDWEFGIPWDEFFRFIKTSGQTDRVLEALCDPRVQELTTGYPEFPQIIRLRPDNDSLQKAMNIAGKWFDGFEIPQGVEVISLTPRGEELIQEIGLDAAARFLAWKMEQEKIADSE